MNGAARQHDRRQRAVRAAVDHEVDVHGAQLPVARDRGAVPRARRVTLGRRRHVLGAAVDHLDRPARLPREQRRVAGDHRGILLLAAEASASLHLDDADALGAAGRTVPRARGGCSTGHCIEPHTVTPCFGSADRQHAVRLDVELLLRAGLVLTFDDDDGLAANAASTSPLLTCSVLKMLSVPQMISRAQAPRRSSATAGSGSMSIVTRRRASSAVARSRCAMRTIGSSGWLTTPSARYG